MLKQENGKTNTSHCLGYCGPYKPELFAAAPELLEALRTIDVLSDANSSVGRIARAAIAKAKGVTNP